MKFRPRPVSSLAIGFAAGLALAGADGAWAQTTVLQPENVRIDYAPVLSVRPVYQTLRATRMEQRCEPVPAATQTPSAEDTQARGLARLVGAVKDALGGSEKPAPAAVSQACEQVPVKREFTRPIAYDVDYLYKGAKYRSRLPYDPGHKLKIKVSVAPVVVTAPDD